MVSGLLMSLLDNMTSSHHDPYSPPNCTENSKNYLPTQNVAYAPAILPNDIECTISELEKDCDTLENEANRLLNINRELRIKLGEEIPQNLENFLEDSGNGETSFAAETLELEKIDERPGPEGRVAWVQYLDFLETKFF